LVYITNFLLIIKSITYIPIKKEIIYYFLYYIFRTKLFLKEQKENLLGGYFE